MPDLIPGAIWHPSSISHPMRPKTLGIVIHWTVGHEAGDVQTLDGPSVDVHAYVAKSGRVYQFLDPDSQAWHAFHTANTYCLGIETEGAGEAWTPAQLAAVARVTAYFCKRYGIPVRHAQPKAGNDASFIGIFGHRDLRGIDGNTHTDSVPDGTGWPRFLAAVTEALAPPKPTVRQRLIKGLLLAGFGGKSARAIADRLFPKK